MTYESNWGYSNGFDEYGRALKCTPREVNKIDDSENDFILTLRVQFLAKGYAHYTVSIVSDYESCSCRLISSFLLDTIQDSHTVLNSKLDIQLFCPIVLSDLQIQRYLQQCNTICRIQVQFSAISNSRFHHENFYDEMIWQRCRHLLHRRGYIALQEDSPECNGYLETESVDTLAKSVVSSTQTATFRAVSLLNLTSFAEPTAIGNVHTAFCNHQLTALFTRDTLMLPRRHALPAARMLALLAALRSHRQRLRY